MIENGLRDNMQTKPRRIKSLFTTKHYKAIAEIVRILFKKEAGLSEDVCSVIFDRITKRLEQDNKKFSSDKFLKLVNKS